MLVPILIETVHSARFADVQVCRKAMASLFRMGVKPLPFASTNEELLEVFDTLLERNSAPAIFVVNAFGIEHLFPQLDTLMGDTPAIFLRRELYAHTPALKDVFGAMDHLTNSQYLGRLTPRLAVAWNYGPRSSQEVADKVARSVVRYLETGDFTLIERAVSSKKDPGISVA